MTDVAESRCAAVSGRTASSGSAASTSVSPETRSATGCRLDLDTTPVAVGDLPETASPRPQPGRDRAASEGRSGRRSEPSQARRTPLLTACAKKPRLSGHPRVVRRAGRPGRQAGRRQTLRRSGRAASGSPQAARPRLDTAPLRKTRARGRGATQSSRGPRTRQYASSPQSAAASRRRSRRLCMGFSGLRRGARARGSRRGGAASRLCSSGCSRARRRSPPRARARRSRGRGSARG
jgi:hypothetical protein